MSIVIYDALHLSTIKLALTPASPSKYLYDS